MLEQILQQFDLTCSDEQLNSMQQYQGFSGALVYRIDSDQGVFALRRWPENSLPRARLQGLHRLLEHLHSSGLTQVAVPRKVSQSSALLKHQGALWQCEPWLPGKADLLENQSDTRLRSTMHVLAEWHQIAKEFKPRHPERQWFFQQISGSVPAIKERDILLESWNRRRVNDVRAKLNRSTEPWAKWSRNYLEIFSQIADKLSAQLKIAQTFQVPLQPCLRDLWHEHVLLEGNEVTGLIDLSACRSENVTVDLTRLLGSLFGDDKLSWDKALEFYQQKRALSQEEILLLEILDQSSVLLSGFFWIDRFLAVSSDWQEEPRIPDRLEKMIQRLVNLKHRSLT